MTKYVAIISVILFGIAVVSGAVKKSCQKDSDCDDDKLCSVDKCKNACLKHPCATNAVCKVIFFYLLIFINILCRI